MAGPEEIGETREDALEASRMITFDSGALIALERRKERAIKVYRAAKEKGVIVATPSITVAEWWRGRTDHRAAILAGILVEPLDAALAKIAGLALARVPEATTIDAVVMAFAAARGDVVYTSDVDDLRRLTTFFPTVRVLSI